MLLHLPIERHVDRDLMALPNQFLRQRANYFCTKTKDVMWGSPSRKSEPWTIYSAVPTATRLTHKVKLSVAWF